MSEYIIVTDSSADLSEEMVKELDVSVLPLSFILRGTTLKNYPDNRDMAPAEFYRLIREGEMPTTSAVNMQEYVDFLTPILEAGKDVLVLAFSSGLSATCQSANLAADELRERFPERKIYVVDTLCASLGQGLLVWYAAQKKKTGEVIEAVRDWCEENKLSLCHWFTVNDLMHLKRGGRVSAATAVAGTLLQIKPVLHVDDEGRLINMAKARGRTAALDALVKRAGETGTELSEQVIFISHSDCLDDAKYVGEKIKEEYHVKDVVYNFIGPVIGSHTGQGCVALFFMGARR